MWGEFINPIQCMYLFSVQCPVKTPVSIPSPGRLLAAVLRSQSWISRMLAFPKEAMSGNEVGSDESFDGTVEATPLPPSPPVCL